jgi:hypothetical protein
MPTTAYYEKIIATMPEGLEKQVLTILMNSVGIKRSHDCAFERSHTESTRNDCSCSSVNIVSLKNLGKKGKRGSL